MKKNIDNAKIVSWLLRIGLAFVFLYAGVSSLQHPLEWIGYLPHFLTRDIASTTLVKVFAFYELILAAWLLSGKYIRYAALLCALTFGSIVIINPSQLIITFRDAGLALMAAALFFNEK